MCIILTVYFSVHRVKQNALRIIENIIKNSAHNLDYGVVILAYIF